MTRFGRIWGSKWHDHVVASGGLVEVTHEWREGLAGMTGEQIKSAIEYCRARHAWPPSIAEFRLAARNGSTGEQAAFAARLREADAGMRALPSETWAETKARGASRLAEIRAQFAAGRRHGGEE